ncbi:MAG: hypothetical protein KDE59_20535 [Anaerolineales bacterium]|nr:hypothetical protein [Anaerolineales bacterium]
MSNENGLMVMDQPLAIMPVMAIAQAVERRAAMVEFVQKIMVKDVDYGRPPGVDKDTLYKAGAEKLNTFFGLSPLFEMVGAVQDWTGADHNGEPFFNFCYRCTLRRGSHVAGQGEGSCNSWEKKYRYRRAELKCPHCGQATVIKGKAEYGGGWLCWGKKGGCGAKFGDHDATIVNQPQGDIPNPNPADLVNTLQKMAQKRALVAATLLAVNASEFFTQDVEDMAGFGDDIIDGQWMPADALSDERQAGPPPVQQRQTSQPRQRRVSKEPAGPVDWRAKLASNPRPTVATVASILVAAKIRPNEAHATGSILKRWPDLEGAGSQLSTDEALMIWDSYQDEEE